MQRFTVLKTKHFEYDYCVFDNDTQDIVAISDYLGGAVILAKDFTNVHYILSGKTWSHVT